MTKIIHSKSKVFLNQVCERGRENYLKTREKQEVLYDNNKINSFPQDAERLAIGLNPILFTVRLANKNDRFADCLNSYGFTVV